MTAKKQNPTLTTLVKAGLSSDEAEIYLSLLERGASSASNIASNTTVKRTYVYHLVEDLQSKGLISAKREGKTTLFEPNSPDHLLGIVEAKRAEISSAERELEGIMGSLKDKYSSVEAKPVVSVFEGVEGLKKIYKDTISVGKDILAFVETSEMNLELREWLKEYYLAERKRNNIKARVILASGKLAKDYHTRNEDALREVIEVEKTKYPIKHEIDIYGDKVAILNYHSKNPLVGIIIDQPLIADTMRAWFELAWDGALASRRKR